jgi:hypothetical protein
MRTGEGGIIHYLLIENEIGYRIPRSRIPLYFPEKHSRSILLSQEEVPP